MIIISVATVEDIVVGASVVDIRWFFDILSASVVYVVLGASVEGV